MSAKADQDERELCATCGEYVEDCQGHLRTPSNALFACKHCSQPAPPEWGADRRCPEYPDRDRPAYMRSCEFEAIPVRLTCGACLFTGDENAILGHSHAKGCVLGDESA